MRILTIEPAGGLWGSERALLDLIDSSPGIEIAVCCPPGAPLLSELRKRNVRIFPYYVEKLHQRSRWWRALAALGVMRACVIMRPDVVHLNQSGAYKTALPAATLLGLPLVCHIRIFEDVAYLAAQSQGLHRIGGLIAISDTVEQEIVRYPSLFPIPSRRIYDAYLPVQNAAPSPHRRMRRRIACVGRLVPIKGQELLLDSLVGISPNEAVECLIVGDGEADYVRHLKNKIANAYHPQVEWLGFVHDVASVLRGCGVLACPSHREPLGRVIFEAWDAGAVPVAFAGSGGAAEIIRSADGGVLYDKQTPEALRVALLRAMTLSDVEAARLVANGRAWLSENCRPERYASKVVGLLDDVRARRAQIGN